MKLYKENRMDKSYELSWEEICNQFISSKFNVNVIEIGNSILSFIANKEGLNSTFSAFDVFLTNELNEARTAIDKIKNQINYYKLLQ